MSESVHEIFFIFSVLEPNPQLGDIEFTYTHAYLLTIEEFRMRLKSPNLSEKEKAIRPGEMIASERLYRINNSHIKVYTLEEHKRRQDRPRKLKEKKLFERYFPMGLNVFLQQLTMDDFTQFVDGLAPLVEDGGEHNMWHYEQDAEMHEFYSDQD